VGVDWVPGYPTTFNAAAESQLIEVSVAGLFGVGRIDLMNSPLAGAEDYSRILEKVPGVFVGLGTTPAGQSGDLAPFNHSAHAQFDDTVLPDGAALYAAWALSRLDLESRRRTLSPVSG
jgi:hippurate hydrolase